MNILFLVLSLSITFGLGLPQINPSQKIALASIFVLHEVRNVKIHFYSESF